MKKFLFIPLALCMSCLSIWASEKSSGTYPKLTYGIEWSYVCSFASYIHQNFYSDEGSRIDFREIDYFHKPEAELFAHIGGNIDRNWNLSLYIGYTKIAHIHYALPISLRLTRYYRENTKNDRWFSYIDLGSGTTLDKMFFPIAIGRLGCGYRFALSRTVKLDIMASYRMIYAQPTIRYYEEYIPKESINRNNGLFSSFTLGFAITL